MQIWEIGVKASRNKKVDKSTLENKNSKDAKSISKIEEEIADRIEKLYGTGNAYTIKDWEKDNTIIDF